MTRPRSDIMAPDNEPTDEELAEVMNEARDEAVRKRDLAAQALRQQIQRLVDERLAQRRQRQSQPAGANSAAR